MPNELSVVRRFVTPAVVSLVVLLFVVGEPVPAHEYPEYPEPLSVWVDIMPGHNPNVLNNLNFRTRVPDGRVPENVEVAWKAGPSGGTWKWTEVDVIILGAPGFDVAGMDYASVYVCCVKPTEIYRGDFMSPPIHPEGDFPQCTWGADGFEDLWLRVCKKDLWYDCTNNHADPPRDGEMVVFELRGPEMSAPQLRGHDHVLIQHIEEGALIEGGTEGRSAALGPCYPNPFNPVTSFTLSLDRPGPYEVDLFNVNGQRVKTFAGYADAGRVTITWDGTDYRGGRVASGIYLYRLRADDLVETRKMLLLK